LTATLRANSHIHLPPNFSAFESVEQAVALASSEGMRVVGASNYYDYTVYCDFAREAERCAIYPLFGIEVIALLTDLQSRNVRINDPGNPGKMYICGKGIVRFDPLTDEALDLLEVIRQKDSDRMAAMTGRLEEVFTAAGIPTGLDVEAVKAQIVNRHSCDPSTVYLQERHVAQSFQEALFNRVDEARRPEVLERLFGAPSRAAVNDGVGVQDEIRSHLMKAGRPAYVTETFVDFEHAYRLILGLGGIPSYPTLADGGARICEFEADVDELIVEINSRGIHAAEFIPIRNSPEVLSRYAFAMRKAGLVLTAGTEHNTREVIPIEPTCVDGQPIPADVREMFWEGACVVAAHQYRIGQGESGYVYPGGGLDYSASSREARIAEFAAMGRKLIDARTQ
jgi:hypothetical protein